MCTIIYILYLLLCVCSQDSTAQLLSNINSTFDNLVDNGVTPLVNVSPITCITGRVCIHVCMCRRMHQLCSPGPSGTLSNWWILVLTL